VARVLLLLPTTTYKAPDFLAAARKLRVDVTVASEEPSTLEGMNPAGLLSLDFRDAEGCARKAVEFARAHPVDAVVGVDEDTAVAAAVIARALGLPHNPVHATVAARHQGHDAVSPGGGRGPIAGVPRVPQERGPGAGGGRGPVSVRLKPTFLAASRGVIRADGEEEFVAAWRRIVKILEEPEIAVKGGEASGEILVEDFVGGREVALEGLLRQGELKVLALFDKPDPLEGPYFEETIYVTPSRLDPQTRIGSRRSPPTGALALGLRDGPVHAELRVNDSGPVLIEIAGRSIGGLCARTLRFGTGMSLEELVLTSALRMEMPEPERERRAAGVMMIRSRGRECCRRCAGSAGAGRGRHRGRDDLGPPRQSPRALARRIALPGFHLQPRRHARARREGAARSARAARFRDRR
jgi:hypothetical protein